MSPVGTSADVYLTGKRKAIEVEEKTSNNATKEKRKVKETKVKYPKFKGERGLVWTLKVWTTIKTQDGKPDEMILRDLMGCITGEAVEWLSDLLESPTPPKTSAELVKLIEKQYTPIAEFGEAMVTMSSMRQGEGETVRAFAQHIATEATNACVSTQDLMVRNAFIQGLYREHTFIKAMSKMTAANQKMNWETFVTSVEKADGVAKATISAAKMRSTIRNAEVATDKVANKNADAALYVNYDRANKPYTKQYPRWDNLKRYAERPQQEYQVLYQETEYRGRGNGQDREAIEGDKDFVMTNRVCVIYAEVGIISYVRAPLMVLLTQAVQVIECWVTIIMEGVTVTTLDM